MNKATWSLWLEPWAKQRRAMHLLFWAKLPVTGSSGIPTHGAKYLDRKSYWRLPELPSLQAFCVIISPRTMSPLWIKVNLSIGGCSFSSSSLEKWYYGKTMSKGMGGIGNELVRFMISFKQSERAMMQSELWRNILQTYPGDNNQLQQKRENWQKQNTQKKI